MVEILKRSVPETPKTVQTCLNCKSVLRYDKDEARQVDEPGRPSVWVVACPVCGHSVSAMSSEFRSDGAVPL